MNESVTDVLIGRRNESKGLRGTVTASFLLHVGIVVVAIAVSRLGAMQPKPAPKVIQINMVQGSMGVHSTGMTALGAKPVEKVELPPKRPEPIKPVAPKSDAMKAPVKPKDEPKPDPKATAPPKPSERTPSTGRELTAGTSTVETNARGTGTGLSTGGSFGGNSPATLDVPFCCPDYIERLCEIVHNAWTPEQARQKGEVTVQFTILKDGSITAIKTDKSYNAALERISWSALYTVQAAGGVGKLPDQFKDDKLVVHLRFPYGIK